MNDTATEAYKNLLRDLQQELEDIGRRVFQAADLAKLAADDKGNDEGVEP